MSRERKKLPADTITDEEVKTHIKEFFDRNYKLLLREGGHALAEGAKTQALEQVLRYWQKLKAIAISVTKTEERLALPGQVTPNGLKFVIEGVVDIVREGDEVWMYDLKTHEASLVRAEPEKYKDQLNVYAYIWKGIRGQRLDRTAIIATRLPKGLRDAIADNDQTAIHKELDTWQPVVELEFNEKDVERTIEEFGRCVDDIEDGKFAPPTPEKLKKPLVGTRTFAQIHCQNCDARFSCSSYRAYQKTETKRSRGRRTPAQRDEEMERELDAWIDENLADS